MALLMEMRHEVSHSYHGRNVIHRCSKAKVEPIVMWHFAKVTNDCSPFYVSDNFFKRFHSWTRH
jgi:hypothetical protein